MKRLILAACVGLGTASVPGVRAQEAVEPLEYSSAYFEPLFVHSSNKGRKILVQEYDVRRYAWFEGSLGVSKGGRIDPKAAVSYFDLEALGLGSNQESVGMSLGIGRAWRTSLDFDLLAHRVPFTRTFIQLNGFLRPNPELPNKGSGYFTDPYFRRAAVELKNLVRLPEWSRTSLWFDYWREQEWGSREARWSGKTLVGIANIERQTQDYVVGAGVEATDTLGVAYEHVYRTFADSAEPIWYDSVPSNTRTSAAQAGQSLPRSSPFRMNENELKVRYSPTNSLGLTAYLSANERNNSFNGYLLRTYTGQLAGTYATGNLGLTARLYMRSLINDENAGFRDLFNAASGQLVDKNTVRAELDGRYRVHHRVKVKAGYKVEANQRRDAPTQFYGNIAVYDDGLIVPAGTQTNAMARQDTKHTIKAGATAELPLGVELEGEVKRMIANQAVFENMPDWQDEAGLSVSAPLPADVWVYGAVGYLREANRHSKMSGLKGTSNRYQAGVSWTGGRVGLGADFEHENSRSNSDLYFGDDNFSNVAIKNPLHRGGSPYLEQNNTVSGNARVALVKGLSVSGRGSYTRSKSNIPLFLPAATFRAPAGKDFGNVSDLAPREVRITNVGGTVEYAIRDTITARAGHRVAYYVDITDPDNTGRVNITEVVLNLKF